jgi:prepilin-type N-terminal cleavage/methylation domain-containing protein
MTSSSTSGSVSSQEQLRARALRQRARRGFTLIELIISMMAGLLISAAAFLLARNASAFFQHESRMTSAQFGAIVGMARLESDLRRASFQTTPNVNFDPRLCGGQAGWPAGMQELAGIYIQNGGSVVRHPTDHALSTANALAPDALILSGLFGTTEQFSVSVLALGQGGGITVQLQNDGGLRRTQEFANEGGESLQNIFRVGRFLRILDQEGRFGYGVITGMTDVGDTVTISLSANPALPTREAVGVCGCEGFCTGALVNPVARVLYDLRAIDTVAYPQYLGLYQKAGHAESVYHKGTPEPARTELVRVELDAQNAEIATSLEIIAEYAVDLKFGATVEVPQNPAAPVPVLQRYPIGNPNVYAASDSLAAGGTPEDIRAVQVRISTRTAEADRERGIPGAATDGGLLRYNLGINDNSGNPAHWARMRTLITDVQLHNQARPLL